MLCCRRGNRAYSSNTHVGSLHICSLRCFFRVYPKISSGAWAHCVSDSLFSTLWTLRYIYATLQHPIGLYLIPPHAWWRLSNLTAWLTKFYVRLISITTAIVYRRLVTDSSPHRRINSVSWRPVFPSGPSINRDRRASTAVNVPLRSLVATANLTSKSWIKITGHAKPLWKY